VKIKEPERARLKIKLQYPVDIFFCRQTTRNEKISSKKGLGFNVRKPVFALKRSFPCLRPEQTARAQEEEDRPSPRVDFLARSFPLVVIID